MRNTSCQPHPRVRFFADCLALGLALLLVVPAAHAASVRSKPAESHVAARRAAVITGTVTDQSTKTAIQGVTVRVEGTSLAAVTGQDGKYRMLNVAAGSYTLTARRLGYAPQRRAVTVTADAELTEDF